MNIYLRDIYKTNYRKTKKKRYLLAAADQKLESRLICKEFFVHNYDRIYKHLSRLTSIF